MPPVIKLILSLVDLNKFPISSVYLYIFPESAISVDTSPNFVGTATYLKLAKNCLHKLTPKGIKVKWIPDGDFSRCRRILQGCYTKLEY